MGQVFARLERAYVALFREYPPLLRLALVTGASQMAFALLNVYALPVYLIRDLGVSGQEVGAVSATFLLSETALKFPLGRLSDRLGRKPLIVLGPLATFLNPAVFVSLPVRWWRVVFPLRVVDGAGAAALWPPLFAMVGDLVKEKSRAAAMSVMNGVYVGAIGLAAAAGSLVAHVTGSNRSPFYLATVLLFVSAVTAYVGLPKEQRSKVAAEEGAEAAAMGVVGGDPESPGGAWYPLWLVLLITLLMTLGVLMLASFLVVYVQVDLGLSALQTLELLGALAVPVLVLGLPLGHAADRWGKSWAVRISLALSAAVMWTVPSCRTWATFGAAAMVLVLSHIMGTPAWLALVSQLAPRERRGGMMSMVATAEGVGAGIGPLVGGRLWDMQHAYIFYGSAALLTAAAAVACCALREKGWARPGGR